LTIGLRTPRWIRKNKIDKIDQIGHFWSHAQASAVAGPKPPEAMKRITEVAVRLPSALASMCDALEVPVTFADPDLIDLPLIYANPAFCRMTGWSAEALEGVNCRILQGPDSDRSVIAEMGQCCTTRRSDIFTLVNYRRTGEPFVNIVGLRPIRISDSKRLIMGCQMEFRRFQLEDDLARHSEAIGSVIHLVRTGRSFRRNGLKTQDLLRVETVTMRFETAFVMVQNALIRKSAQNLLDTVHCQRDNVLETPSKRIPRGKPTGLPNENEEGLAG
jgi:PAS domain S-box-containing protein